MTTVDEPDTEQLTPGQQTANRRAAALRVRAEGILRLAELIEANPELDACYLEPDKAFVEHAFYARTKEDWQAVARAGLRHGAKVAKNAGDDYFEVALSWPGITFKALGSRNGVCRKVKIGEEIIVEEVPDPEAVAALPTVKTTRVEEKFEWRCEPLLADESPSVVA